MVTEVYRGRSCEKLLSQADSTITSKDIALFKADELIKTKDTQVILLNESFTTQDNQQSDKDKLNQNEIAKLNKKIKKQRAWLVGSTLSGLGKVALILALVL